MRNKSKTSNHQPSRRDFLQTSLISRLALSGLGAIKASAASMSPSGDAFAGIKQQLMLDPSLKYLNTGTLGPCPKGVFDTVAEINRQLEMNPAVENFGPLLAEMEKTRGIVANFIKADEEEIILTRNTTEGISLVCSGIDFKAGDEILTTNHEHGGAMVGLNFLAETKGATIKQMTMPLPIPDKETLLAMVQQHISDKTKLILLSHVETITGLRWPIEEVAKIARARGIIFIVDGAQAPGMLDIDMQAIDCDAYASSGHKWTMGPKETGFLYLNKRLQPHVKHAFIASNYHSYSASSGTRNAANLIGLGAVMKWHMTLGQQNIEAQCKKMAHYCKQQLLAIPGVSIISSDDERLQTAIVSFTYEKDLSNGDLRKHMNDKGIIIKRLPQHNAVRISNHMFTSKGDIDAFITELRKELT